MNKLNRQNKSPLGILPRLIILSAIVWVLSIVLFGAIIVFATRGLTGSVQDTKFGNSELFVFLLVSSIGVGILAFGLLFLFIFILIMLKKKVLVFKKSFKGILAFGFKLLLLLAVLPLFFIYKVVGLGKLIKNIKQKRFKLAFSRKDIKPVVTRLIAVIAISLTFLPFWVGGYWFIGMITTQQLGYINESIPSTGSSMYPTHPEGESVTGMLPYPNGLTLFGKRILGHQIGRGDIVVVEDDKTRKTTQELHGYPSGWLKRVIAAGDDTLEIRDGLVYLNDQPLKEPYIAKAHSTFGQTFLKECSKVTIPENSIFVMGDNRKGSGDSREVGFFSINDIKYVLPMKSQKGDLVKNWRDTSKDFDESSKIKLDKEKYLELLNEKRKEVGAKPLKYQPKLGKSAFKRGEVILKYDDFSYEATKSGYIMEKSMRDAGYSNIIWDEAFAQGYYEAEELIEYYFEFPEWKKFLLEKDFQEFAVAEVEGEINGCPTQIIVQHFAGYVPPNYTRDVVESWRSSLNNLNEVIHNWEKVREYSRINQSDLEKLLSLFYRERIIASNILFKMEANKWLTRDEESSIKEYERLSSESVELADKLND